MALETINYLIINVSCLAFSLIIYFRVNSDVGSVMETRFFQGMLNVFILFLIVDSFWELGVSKTIPMPVLLRRIFNAAGLFLFCILSYLWFAFAETRMKLAYMQKKWFVLITLIPVFIVVFCLLASFRTGWVFYSDRDAEYHGPMYSSIVLLDFMYLTFIMIHALIKMRRTKSRAKRREYFLMVSMVIFPFAAGIFDSFIPNTPIMAPSVFSSLLLVFVNMQESQIYYDALTGLNNRRRADQILESSILSADDSNGVYVFMIDIDRFKKINDRFGHLEGDRALQETAKCMSGIAGNYSVFVSRWGGDEFMMIGRQKNLEPVEDFVRQINSGISSASKALQLPYELSVSIGYELCSSPDAKPEDVVSAADENLYLNKQRLQRTG